MEHEKDLEANANEHFTGTPRKRPCFRHQEFRDAVNLKAQSNGGSTDGIESYSLSDKVVQPQKSGFEDSLEDNTKVENESPEMEDLGMASGSCSSTLQNFVGSSSPAHSEASESDWQPSTNGMIDWIHSQILDDKDPRDIIYKLVPSIVNIPAHVDNWTVWRWLIRLLSEPPRRKKLQHVNTIEDVIRLIKKSTKIMVLTGAGVSVSCGIPDFRSRDGVYARLAIDFPDLPNPEAMFDITYFKHDPRPFFKFAKEIYPGQYKPSCVHRFINLLEKTGKLLRNYTQNIDTLEQVAGISRVVQCHGSFATASCQVCKHQVDCEAIREDIFNQVVPHCPNCTSNADAILKPDIVFFGENLPSHFHRQMTIDKDEADLLIVIGSALKVRPVALIPNSIPEEIPQILINREPLSHMSFDVELLGDGDVIISEISRLLGEEFESLCEGRESLTQVTQLAESTPVKSMVTLSPKVCNKLDAITVDDNSEESSLYESSNEKKSNTSTVGDVIRSEGNTSWSEPSTMCSENSGQSCDTNTCSVSSDSALTTPINAMNEKSPSNHNRNKDEVKQIEDVVMSSKNNTSNYANETCKEEKSAEIEKDCLWQSRWKQSISNRLPDYTYYFDGGHRYIFSGAEVAPEEESDSSSDDDNESSSSSSEDEAHIGPGELSSIRRHYTPPRVLKSNNLKNALAVSEGCLEDDANTSSLDSNNSSDKPSNSSQNGDRSEQCQLSFEPS